ncbi:PstS family phosphate ABC transporter substrate-binding protein [Pectobacterium wasabiae]|uniref:Phosphate-binding protein n=1 Tax=Pectobacterium wasabiae TaxID=55208 RepID=A0AAW3ELB9_9GAMM|nr:phosphate ABC transporter substrate-binding protein [Pectobacterium wasabiae]AOR64380.1 phosphate ABC transporter substrate-binding protein [Pectobacterium wasabiae CFBP 3304]EJS92479.1 Putative phosphate binding protein [Pectobacterium wasabiae CFBP 3304]KFX09128.1 phosphate ABC transporter substrate-binding protein [Pectobacterium wasabiae]KGA29235.1 phosphate ABC transporter substrate-binding protein [Pectobacterium wasabiae]
MISAIRIAGAFLLLLSAFCSAQPRQMLAGNLSSAGSDTLANLMAFWATDFSQHYPNVNLQIQAAGSSSAPTSLASGAAQLGPMSRAMKASEIEAFVQHYGYPPLAVPVAMDALVVLVNQDNPLSGLNLSQLDAIFSITQRCGNQQPIKQWGDLGLRGSWEKRTLLRYGRNSASGTYGFFKQKALCRGDFLPQVNELPSSASVVQAVAASTDAIGYASVGFRTSGVKMLPLAAQGTDYISPSTENIRSGLYPYTRYLYIYVNKAPGQPLEALTAAFLARVLSETGQSLVNQDGYLPLPEETRRQARQQIGLPE